MLNLDHIAEIYGPRGAEGKVQYYERVLSQRPTQRQRNVLFNLLVARFVPEAKIRQSSGLANEFIVSFEPRE